MGFSSLAWSKKSSAFLAGGSNGTIYKWNGTTPVVFNAAHKKMVSCINVCENNGNELIITGSSDKTIKVFSYAGGNSANL